MSTARLARARAKTSVEIMQERDALDARLRDVEEALDAIESEAERALRRPELASLALRRVAAMVRRARGVSAEAPESGIRKSSA